MYDRQCRERAVSHGRVLEVKERRPDSHVCLAGSHTGQQAADGWTRSLYHCWPPLGYLRHGSSINLDLRPLYHPEAATATATAACLASLSTY
ncbi:hypothetical protein E2C01_021295 [Portunus trituberculatus]|uniref:Uncharacterized protein n=1 Tax=Portunus trituberculatus TaxID=210409 RepID=A0A5B7E2B5_PORTR|nr:hypothetical protein [Portunus trituberculatus]